MAKMDVRVIAPPVVFVIGIIVIFISGGDKMFQVVGAALVALAGIGFMIISNKSSSVIP
jgi:xanthosine utilization system XapX-like protein